MSYTSPGVYYSATLNGTYTAINGVQSVNITRGKSRFVDPFPASSCVIELIPDATYTLPFAIGQFVDIRDTNSGSSAAYFNGKIVDIQRSYGIPYNSSTGYAPGDRIFLTVSGGTGALASTYINVVGTGWNDCNVGLYNYLLSSYIYNTWTPVNTGIPFKAPPQDIISPTTQMMCQLDYTNYLLNTCQYSIDEADMLRTPISNGGGGFYYVGVYTLPNSDTSKTFTFTDNYTGSANSYKYSGIEFGASKQSIFTQVTVKPLDAPEATVSTGLAPFNGAVYSTLSDEGDWASSLATYLLEVSKSTASTPFIIDSSTSVDSNIKTLGKLAEAPIGTGVNITFRGTTTTALLIGVNVAFYADRMNCRFTFAPSLGTPFTLDSSAFGVLDQNRLGYP